MEGGGGGGGGGGGIRKEGWDEKERSYVVKYDPNPGLKVSPEHHFWHFSLTRPQIEEWLGGTQLPE